MAASIPGAADLGMHVKGLELPAYDPRASSGMALAYATSDRGGCHLRAWPVGDELLAAEQRLDPFSNEFKAELVKSQQDLFCLVNCSGLCLFVTFAVTLKQLTPLLHAATGLEALASAEGLLQIGERVNTLVRNFNLREGLTRADDRLPARFLKEPLAEGPARGRVVDFAPLLAEYYFVRGWDAEGRPTPAKLKALGIDI